VRSVILKNDGASCEVELMFTLTVAHCNSLRSHRYQALSARQVTYSPGLRKSFSNICIRRLAVKKQQDIAARTFPRIAITEPPGSISEGGAAPRTFDFYRVVHVTLDLEAQATLGEPSALGPWRCVPMHRTTGERFCCGSVPQIEIIVWSACAVIWPDSRCEARKDLATCEKH